MLMPLFVWRVNWSSEALRKKSEKIYVYLVLPLCSTFICVLLNRISVTDEDKISSWILKSTVTRRRASITDFIQQVKENYYFYCYAFSLMPPSMCFATRVDVLKSDFGSEWDWNITSNINIILIVRLTLFVLHGIHPIS